MPDRPKASDPSAPDVNPLGLGPRGRESSNTGSEADTSYDAHASDPYETGEPRKDFNAGRGDERAGGTVADRADADLPSSDEP